MDNRDDWFERVTNQEPRERVPAQAEDERSLKNHAPAQFGGHDVREWYMAIGAIFACVLAMAISWWWNTTFPPSAPPQSTSTHAGDECRLETGADTIFVAATEADSDEMYKWIAARDSVEIARMAEQGRVYIVKAGTRVKVLDVGILQHTVRILEGGYAGRSCVVPVEYVKKVP